jgi:nicotinate phosphoribosyltransferase
MTPAHRRGGALGLYTDLYELRMAQTCLREGMTAPATFSLYIRPTSRRPWIVAAGIDRALDVVESFAVEDADLDWLRGQGFGNDLLDWLRTLEPNGDIWAVPDGTLLLAEEPILEITAPLPAAMLPDTAVLTVAHCTTLIATKPARGDAGANGRTLADFGLRRAHGLEAGLEAARAAYIGGVGATSNVAAGRAFGIPVVGTMAHSFVQARENELESFRAFARDHPDDAVLLVDTYDSIDGVRNAITVADEMRKRGEQLAGIRLDSGDLGALAREARRMLDAAGHQSARIVASGGVDEYVIHDLLVSGAPIDGFGVGTALTVSRDQPAFDIVYKLVEYDGQPRAKYSEGKVLLPGRKQVFRSGSITTDVLARRDETLEGEPLLSRVWRDGERLVTHDIEESRARVSAQVAALPDAWRRPAGPEGRAVARVSDGLRELALKIRSEETSS